jgi:putative membrane protein
MKKNIFRISIRNSIIISYVIGLFLVIGWTVISAISSIVEYGQARDIAAEIVAIPLWGGFVAALFIYPIVLAVYQLVMLILETDKMMSKTGVGFDQIVIWYGFILEGLYIAVVKDATGSDWSEVLTNSETHTPIFTGAGLTICVLCFIGLIGYYYLRICSLKKIPPLLAVFSISAMYIWLVVIVIFTVQVFGSGGMVGRYSDLYLLIYPFCIACIIIRTILCKVREWNELEMERGKIQNNVILNFLDKILSNSRLWPIYALVLMLPLLGIIIAILLLFGQAPDSVIKAWTETADWRLSMKEAPQNIYYDEHYLCTVAAGGHKKIVKPLRKGVRHGHEVIVNRQLCVANAFEQILEEKTPRFHKLVRGIYDRYGFPVARLIKSKWIADIIYILMKPLEWIFLMVIYMNDVKPENRIATQYMSKIKKGL